MVVVHVRHESAMAAANIEAGAGVAISEALDEVEQMSRERAAGVLAGRKVDWRFEVSGGDPATELIAAARAHEARAIVVGGRSHGLVGGLVVGSVAQKLVRHSPVSVLVVRDGKAWAIREISLAEVVKAVVQVEFSPPSKSELELAAADRSAETGGRT